MNGHFIWGTKMATNFKITKSESKKDNDSNYVVKKDFQKEIERVHKKRQENNTTRTISEQISHLPFLLLCGHDNHLGSGVDNFHFP